MNLRFIGGILLIVGTSIGGGMLALPVATADMGFWQSSLVLIVCWILMTLGAFLILEANLYLSRGTHMLSMASATLGRFGLVAAWLSYLFLLYSLLSAYISGGADVFSFLLEKIGFSLPQWQASLYFTLVFGLVVYGGIRAVDYTNRVLMFAKLGIYLLLILFISPKVQLLNLENGSWQTLSASLMILITSFGFAIIVPNLRDYFNDDVAALKKVIFIGSLIPLLCYLAWNAIIMGTIPKASLYALMQNPHTTSELASLLSKEVQNPLITAFFNGFTSICMLTAFLGVSLCLYSFLADGLKWGNTVKEECLLSLFTFLPPLMLVIFIPGAYIHALAYAGIFCVVLLLLLPALMCYFGRALFTSSFQVPGGQKTPIFVAICAFILLFIEIKRILF